MWMTNGSLRAIGYWKTCAARRARGLLRSLCACYSPNAGAFGMGWNGVRSMGTKYHRGFDLRVIATAQACVNYQELGTWAKCMVDTRNAMATVKVLQNKVWKA